MEKIEVFALAVLFIFCVAAWKDSRAETFDGYEWSQEIHATHDLKENILEAEKVEQDITYYELGIQDGSAMTIRRFIQICYQDAVAVILLKRDGEEHKIFCTSAVEM